MIHFVTVEYRAGSGSRHFLQSGQRYQMWKEKSSANAPFPSDPYRLIYRKKIIVVFMYPSSQLNHSVTIEKLASKELQKLHFHARISSYHFFTLSIWVRNNNSRTRFPQKRRNHLAPTKIKRCGNWLLNIITRGHGNFAQKKTCSMLMHECLLFDR